MYVFRRGQSNPEFCEYECISCLGDIEDRGHSGRNFVFMDLDGNKFDVWSELSPSFKKMFEMEKL